MTIAQKVHIEDAKIGLDQWRTQREMTVTEHFADYLFSRPIGRGVSITVSKVVAYGYCCLIVSLFLFFLYHFVVDTNINCKRVTVGRPVVCYCGSQALEQSTGGHHNCSITDSISTYRLNTRLFRQSNPDIVL